MTSNVGNADRLFRFALGVILLVAPFISGMAIFEGSVATIISVLAGLVMLATASMRFCPLYRIFGIRTCKV
jgi:hypothetical protein